MIKRDKDVLALSSSFSWNGDDVVLTANFNSIVVLLSIQGCLLYERYSYTTCYAYTNTINITLSFVANLAHHTGCRWKFSTKDLLAGEASSSASGYFSVKFDLILSLLYILRMYLIYISFLGGFSHIIAVYLLIYQSWSILLDFVI